MDSYVIGIDIGTGSIKAIAMNTNGRVLQSHRNYYPSNNAPFELDPVLILNAFIIAVRNMVDVIGYPPFAVSLSSIMHGLMAVDAKCQPLTGLILWSDKRSTSIAESLRGSALGNEIYTATGTPIHAMSPLCKIKWFYQSEKNVFDSAHKFISIKEFIWFHLFKEYRIDYSVASATGMFNIELKQWHQQALDWIPLSSEKLSRPVQTDYSNSKISSVIAVEMGIQGTKFIIGASDGCLANLGSHCMEPEIASITIGTSAAVRITNHKSIVDMATMPFNYILDDEHLVCGGAINNGGNIIQWLVEHFMMLNNEEASYHKLFETISGIPAGSEGLVFLPYLHGERAPIWDEKSSGVYFGIRYLHTNAHMARAAIEGICYALSTILYRLEDLAVQIKEIRFSGAVSKHPVLVQMLADVTNKKVIVNRDEDASCIGACYLGLNLMGVEINKNQPGTSSQFNPFYDNVKVYKDRLKTYQSLYPALHLLM